jgi:hypothetical protein
VPSLRFLLILRFGFTAESICLTYCDLNDNSIPNFCAAFQVPSNQPVQMISPAGDHVVPRSTGIVSSAVQGTEPNRSGNGRRKKKGILPEEGEIEVSWSPLEEAVKSI